MCKSLDKSKEGMDLTILCEVLYLYSPVLRGAFFQLVVALPLPALTALSECLPVLLTRAVAEAAFCSLGDWLNVCRTPRGVVAEPRDSWLEAYSEERV